MDLIELGRALSELFDQGLNSPSHDEITNAVRRAGLSAGDPRQAPSDTVGKVKRVREVFIYATDHAPDAGLPLATHLVALLRATGAFTASSEGYGGSERIAALKRAFAVLGWDLDGSGALRPLAVDNLSGTELNEALQSYVRRANLNPDDAALQVGNGKDLDEAAARHVLVERTGAYPMSSNFPTTLAQAFMALSLEPAPPGLAKLLDSDPHKAVQQCLYQLACAVNRLRNDMGTGHGRPGTTPATPTLSGAEGRLVARATALVAGLLLDAC